MMAIEICGLCIIVLGWFVNNILSKRKEHQYQQRRDQKNYLDSQLSKLYGPIYGILLENERLVKQLQDQFNREIVFRMGIPLTPREEKIWVHMLEKFFFPNNRRIINLILQNVDLIEGNRFPNSFLHFIDYAVGFELLHKQYLDLNIPYGFHYIENFPQEFQKEIILVTSKLKQYQWNLVDSQTMLKVTKQGDFSD